MCFIFHDTINLLTKIQDFILKNPSEKSKIFLTNFLGWGELMKRIEFYPNMCIKIG